MMPMGPYLAPKMNPAVLASLCRRSAVSRPAVDASRRIFCPPYTALVEYRRLHKRMGGSQRDVRLKGRVQCLAISPQGIRV
jgi:hypothetical protein